MTVVVIFHNFGPYHCARLQAAAQRLDLVAVEVSAISHEYAWRNVKGKDNYRSITLFSDDQQLSAIEVAHRLIRTLEAYRPDVVAIPGWSSPYFFAPLLWCAQTNTATILMSETGMHDMPRKWWKEFVKRRIVALYSTGLVGGRRHMEYLQHLGMPHDHIFTGYDVVDNAHFASLDDEQPNLTLPANYFLSAARFIPKKNLSTLLRAYADYRRLTGENAWKLVLLGDGPLRDALNSTAANLNLNGHVIMPGFKQYDELPTWYASASAFVHASEIEQWGLVVNEAVAAGLPVIVSNRCGCAPELVVDEVNGFTFEPNDLHSLTLSLVKMASLPPETRKQFGQASREIAARHGPAQFGEGLLRASELALQLPRKRLKMTDRTLLNYLLRH